MIFKHTLFIFFVFISLPQNEHELLPWTRASCPLRIHSMPLRGLVVVVVPFNILISTSSTLRRTTQSRSPLSMPPLLVSSDTPAQALTRTNHHSTTSRRPALHPLGYNRSQSQRRKNWLYTMFRPSTGRRAVIGRWCSIPGSRGRWISV